MKTLRRAALAATLTFAFVQPCTLLIPSALAGAPAPSTTKIKKHKKHKKQKEVVLKGRHGKHARKPA